MSEFPKKISDNGWYELSDGTTVRGEDAAREAEERLQEDIPDTEFEPEPLGVAVEEEETPTTLDGRKCANCDREATVRDAPRTANPVDYCDRHKPAYLR